nr:E3 ubiquitin-protein ligase TRAIP-like isoform X1 [Tanacetum cinerariifolium]
MKCIKLQERNMALAKELAPLKLLFDLNIDEDEIVKLASLDTEAHSKESVDILKRLLVVRNKTYKDLIAKYSLWQEKRHVNCLRTRHTASKAKIVAKPVAKPKVAAVKSKAKPKTPTKAVKVARTSKRSTQGNKAPVAKVVAAKKTPVKKASVKSLKPKAAIANKVSTGRKAKK